MALGFRICPKQANRFSPFWFRSLCLTLCFSSLYLSAVGTSFNGPAMRGPGRAAVFQKSREVACLRKFSFGNTATTTPLPGATFSLWASSWDPFSRSVLVSVATDTPLVLNESFVGDNFLQLSSSGQYFFDLSLEPPSRVLRQDSNWHHYVWSYNETARTITWIIDGELFYEANYSHPTLGINDYRVFDINLCLGNDQDAYFGGFSDGDMFHGAMESFSIYKTPVTLGQAQSIMKGIPDYGLAAQRLAGWEFDDEPSQGPYFVSIYGSSEWTMFRSSGMGDDVLRAVLKGPTRADGCIMVKQQASTAPIFHNRNPLLFVGFCEGSQSVEITVEIQAKSSDVTLRLASLPSFGWLSSVNPSAARYGLNTTIATISANKNAQTQATIRYMAYNGTISPTGDTFTVVAAWTSSLLNMTTLTVKLYLNSPPSISSAKLDAKENKEYSLTFTGSDEDLDNLQFLVTLPPTKGTLKPAGNNTLPVLAPNTTINGYGALFTPFPDTSNAFEYTRFTVMAFDGISYSDPVNYVIRVIPANKLPVLNTSVISAPVQQFTLAEDTSFEFTIPYIHPDSVTTGIQVSQLPIDGTISVIYPGTTTPVVLKSLATVAEYIDQHVSEVVAVSSEYPMEMIDTDGNPFIAFSKDVLLDEQTQLFSDPESFSLNDLHCWYPDSTESCTSLDPEFFYTEWIHIRFARPVSPTFLQLFICQGGTFNVRVRVRHPATGAWHDLASLYTPSSEPSGPWIQKFELCQTTFLVSEVKVDIDNCFAQEWKGLDHVKMQGFTAPPTSVFPQGTRFIYTPPPNYNGDFSNFNATLNFTLTDCIGDSFHQTDVYTIAFGVTPVNDPPVAIPPPDVHAVNAGPTNIILSGTDIEAAPVAVNITTLPALGTLYVNGTAVFIPRQMFYAHPLTVGYAPKDPANCGNDPVTAVQNGVAVVLPFDTFTFSVMDNEHALSSTVMVRIADVACTICIGEKILSRGRCESCPSGYLFHDGSCTAASTSQTAYIVIGAVVGACGLLFLTAVFWAWHRRVTKVRRAKKAAPGGNGSAVLLFTDIQGSTKLWEAHETDMKVALEMHNETIRKLIAQFGGYEVKTQGDSFMVAFDDCLDAVKFSLQIQLDLLSLPWPTGLLTHPNCAAEEAIGEFGRMIWRGLRVRTGMHYGPVEREFDVNTQRIDYFGPTVNCAARIEALAKGGQILMSQEVFAMLSEVENIQTQLLGDFPLKGIGGTKRIFQVNHRDLSARVFDPIQIERVGRNDHPFHNPGAGENTSGVNEVAGVQNCFSCNRVLICKCAAGGGAHHHRKQLGFLHIVGRRESKISSDKPTSGPSGHLSARVSPYFTPSVASIPQPQPQPDP